MALARVNVSSGGKTPPITVNVPTQSGTLTYSGSVKTPTWNGYDATQLLIGGTTSATDAGTYTATFTPQGNVTWSDGTSSPKSVTWTIAKATPVLTLSATTGTIKPSGNTSFTVSTDGTSVWFVDTTDSTVATANTSGNAVNVVGVSSGYAKITVSQAESANYTSATKEYSVVVTPLNTIDKSWEEISTIAQSGNAADYFNVGDCKEITLNGKIGDYCELNNEKLYVFILHINYPINGTADNNIIWGGFKNVHGVNVALADSKRGTESTDGTICFNMNHHSEWNHDGWRGTDFRYDILGATSTPPSEYNQPKSTSNVGYNATAATLATPVPNTLLAALPADLRSVLKLWHRWILVAGGEATSTSAVFADVVDAVSLLTRFEYEGAPDTSSGRALQMDYYATVATSFEQRMTFPHDKWDVFPITNTAQVATSPLATSCVYNTDTTLSRDFYCSNYTVLSSGNTGRAIQLRSYDSCCIAPAFKV